MRVDKDKLLKHKFWALLGVFLLLWLASVSILKLTAAGPLEAKRKQYDEAKKSIEAAAQKRPKNNSFLEPWNKYEKTFAEQKDKVWNQAWVLQRDLITWPSSAAAPFQDRWLSSPTFPEFLKRLAEETTDARGWKSGLARKEFKDTLYPIQFNELDKQVAPVELRGGIEGIFQPVAWRNSPSIEELWLAQEDFWVRGELLGVVRAVLDAAAHFDRVPANDKEAKPAGAVARHRFRNANWELDLVIEGQPGKQMQIGPRSEIKNVQINKRVMSLANAKTNKGLAFRLRQKGNTFVLRVEGEPLAWNQSSPFRKATPVDSIKLDKPFDVEQIFDWYTAPVRRIDALQPAWQSHRTSSKPLLPNPVLALADPKEEKPADGGSGGGIPAGGIGGGAGMGGGFPAGMGGNPGGREGGADLTPNGLKRNRYIHLTEQCRHMPIGMLLIVDQANIHDVLIAVANSRLRIQTTQVTFNHVRNVKPPSDDSQPEERRDFRPMGGAPRPAMPLAGPMAGARPAAGTASDEDDPNLVELAIYGIATLYERFPDNRPLPPDAPAPAPATPAPAAPTTPAPMPMPAPTPRENPKGENPKAAAPANKS